MAGSTNVSIRMDADLKAQADALFGELGMNMSTAFNESGHACGHAGGRTDRKRPVRQGLYRYERAL